MDISAKKIAEILRSVNGDYSVKKFTSAVIVAGGSSTRMGEGVSKQMLTLCSMPLVVHTLMSYQRCTSINEIIVVAKADEITKYELFKEKFNITKLTSVVKGGKTRQESCLEGFKVISKKAKFVAFADGARPLITPEDIAYVCVNAYKYGAASACEKAKDTIKIVDRNGFVIDCPDREKVRLASTPQVFEVNLYRAAAYSALEAGFSATDDNSLVERIGHCVKTVVCESPNIKVTTKDDLKIAEAIIKDRIEKGAGKNE